jgi:hypothetical protein
LFDRPAHLLAEQGCLPRTGNLTLHTASKPEDPIAAQICVNMSDGLIIIIMSLGQFLSITKLIIILFSFCGLGAKQVHIKVELI